MAKKDSAQEETFEMPSVPSIPNVGKFINKRKVLNLFNKVKPTSYTQILVVLLVVASFLLGVLYTKVQYLQGNNAQAVGGLAPTTATDPNAAAAPGAKVDLSVGHLPVMGDKNAKVTIIEFADFRCPFCEQFYTQTEGQLIKDYVDTGKVKFAFRHFAFLGPASITAADASECANDQGKFWEYHDYLYKNQPAETDTTMYNTDTLTQAAVSLGMDGNSFRSCLDTKKDEALVTQDQTEGSAAGISGTPTFVINGTLVVGAQPYDTLKTTIDQELAK